MRAHSLIIATGAIAKRLGLPHEEEFWNNGISACAVCDGASANYRKQELAVVGGGDTAAEEALYLTKYGTKVRLLALQRQGRSGHALMYAYMLCLRRDSSCWEALHLPCTLQSMAPNVLPTEHGVPGLCCNALVPIGSINLGGPKP